MCPPPFKPNFCYDFFAMIASTYIDPGIPSLKPCDTAHTALAQMEEYELAQLPVVEPAEAAYLGLAAKPFLQEIDASVQMQDLLLSHRKFFVFADTHLYNIVAHFADTPLNIIAVLSSENKYEGIIVQKDLQNALAKLFADQQAGSLLTLSMETRQYSMQVLGKLIESNQAKILTSFVHKHPESAQKILLTLKINQPDLSLLINTLNRFGYHVKARYDKPTAKNFERERIDLLLKYLEI